MTLPDGKTLKGRRVAWRNGPLLASDPLSAWRKLLAARGLDESDAFFTPRLSDLPDPDTMQDMPKASARLAEAIIDREPIHIFGDFDCDGVCGTAILYDALRAAGAQVSFSIPHRAEDGHGIGVDAVRVAVANGARLGLSVDTGTTCFAACEEAARLGMDLIVSDHHLPEKNDQRERLPDAFALLNPARADCGFAERRLCGAGVAFFLLMSVWRRLRRMGRAPDFDLRSLLDRVAVATVADVMSLVGVNRILVYHGLRRLNQDPCVGLKALMRVARIKNRVDVESIAFHLAPRINAAGRMRHGEDAMRMLCASDIEEAMHLARILDETNKQRRLVEAEVFKQAEARVAGDEVLAVYHGDWHAGVVGLAAGRLARKYGKPAAVGFITPENEVRVSLRGRPGFHVGDLLFECAEHLEGFGGHAGAGGCTVKREKWDAFVSAFGEAVARQARNAGEQHLLFVDGILTLSAMHPGLAERLRRFEPVGEGNPPCVWLVSDLHIIENRPLKGGVTRLKVSDGARLLDAVVFAGNAFADALERGRRVSLIGRLELDDYRGGGAIQFVVEDALAR